MGAREQKGFESLKSVRAARWKSEFDSLLVQPKKEAQMASWIGVDLDGTLAFYDEWRGIEHIGEPIPAMVRRVKYWIANNQEVRIFTARVYQTPESIPHIEQWCLTHIGQILPVTNVKDFDMLELWDDRAVSVVTNTGKTHREYVGF